MEFCILTYWHYRSQTLMCSIYCNIHIIDNQYNVIYIEIRLLRALRVISCTLKFWLVLLLGVQKDFYLSNIPSCIFVLKSFILRFRSLQQRIVNSLESSQSAEFWWLYQSEHKDLSNLLFPKWHNTFFRTNLWQVANQVPIHSIRSNI